MPCRIQAISYYLPDRIYTNDDFFRDFPAAKGTSLEKSGVKERHLSAPDQISSDLGVEAGKKLFIEHSISPESIDLLIVGLVGPDYYTPATAGIMHERLGLRKNCGAVDFTLGCSAYVYGLSMADGMMQSLGIKNILFITQSSLTKTFHPNDRSSRFIFGDGAAATLITASEQRGIGPYVLGNDGSGFRKIIIEDGGQRNPVSKDSDTEIKDEFGNITSRATFRMDGVGVFLFSMKTVPRLIKELLEKASLKMEDIDVFIFHQANTFMNEKLRMSLKIPPEKFIHCMDKTGNTVQSTIPIAIYEAKKSGQLKKGMKVLLAGFGVGLSWSATIAEF